MNQVEKEALKRKLFFVPCETEEDLRIWIKTYLGLDIPNCTLDPESNSNPMALIWEIYSKGRAKVETNSFLAYAAREAFKTLGAAVLEFLFLVHMERDVAHMAAVESQSQNSQKYVKKFIHRPIIRDFITKSNERRIEFTRYKGPNGLIFSPKEFAQMSPSEKEAFSEHTNYIQIVIATIQGANSEHVAFFVMDELDVAPARPVEEAKMIPTQAHDGSPSITVMTSTRKSTIGPVQAEIDNAEETGLQIRHWNIIDVTKPCPATRHRPDLPKLPIYSSNDTLRAMGAAEYDLLPPKEKETYTKSEGYAGCLSNCRLFAVCKGRLATDQKSQSRMLKDISEVQKKIRSLDVDTAKAQMMCWKPGNEGLIYSRLNPERHFKTAAQMAEMITGEPVPTNFSKQQLVNLMKSRQMAFYSGVDHGFTHMFAVVTGALDGNRMFIFDAIAETELEISQKVDRCKDRFGSLGIEPVMYADPEDPASNKTLGRSFTVRAWKKDAGSVVEGIQIVRMKLNPTMGRDPELYFLKEDDQVALLFKQLSRYHWKLDAAGLVTKDPDKVDDDLCDGCRYLVMNVFNKNGRLVVGSEQRQEKLVAIPGDTGASNYTQENWMKKKVEELTGSEEVKSTGSAIQKGRFFMDF